MVVGVFWIVSKDSSFLTVNQFWLSLSISSSVDSWQSSLLRLLVRSCALRILRASLAHLPAPITIYLPVYSLLVDSSAMLCLTLVSISKAHLILISAGRSLFLAWRLGLCVCLRASSETFELVNGFRDEGVREGHLRSHALVHLPFNAFLNTGNKQRGNHKYLVEFVAVIIHHHH